jgi:molecular chaperone GrpE
VSEENINEVNEENPNMKIEKEPENETEKKIMDLKEALDKLKADNDEKDDRIKRLMAEFENFKKRSNKEREGLYSSVMGDVILQILPVIDNLEKAVESKTEDQEYKNGIILVLEQLKETLKKNGVTEIESVGKPFDPSLHEAISMVQDPNLGEKIVQQEYRKGYMIGDRVLRHAMVIVAN